MQLIIKHFNDLTLNELVEIYKVRISVFVVEQKCPYQEVDDAHQNDYHIRVVSDAVAGSSKRAHKYALEAIYYLQHDALITTKDVESALEEN